MHTCACLFLQWQGQGEGHMINCLPPGPSEHSHHDVGRNGNCSLSPSLHQFRTRVGLIHTTRGVCFIWLTAVRQTRDSTSEALFCINKNKCNNAGSTVGPKELKGKVNVVMSRRQHFFLHTHSCKICRAFLLTCGFKATHIQTLKIMNCVWTQLSAGAPILIWEVFYISKRLEISNMRLILQELSRNPAVSTHVQPRYPCKKNWEATTEQENWNCWCGMSFEKYKYAQSICAWSFSNYDLWAFVPARKSHNFAQFTFVFFFFLLFFVFNKKLVLCT